MGDVIISQGTPGLAEGHQRMGERQGTDPPSEAPEGTHPINFGFLSSRTMSKYISIVFSCPICGNLLW